MTDLKARAGWLGQRDVTARILEAVSAKRPFSLIRLGDGEGAFLRLDAGDEATYPSLYDANRDNRMAMWFGSDFPWRTNGFFEDTHHLADAVRSADIVAVPDLPWLSNAYRIMSISGVPSLANIVRCFKEATRAPGHGFATASIAKELHLQSRYDEDFPHRQKGQPDQLPAGSAGFAARAFRPRGSEFHPDPGRAWVTARFGRKCAIWRALPRYLPAAAIGFVQAMGRRIGARCRRTARQALCGDGKTKWRYCPGYRVAGGSLVRQEDPAWR